MRLSNEREKLPGFCERDKPQKLHQQGGRPEQYYLIADGDYVPECISVKAEDASK